MATGETGFDDVTYDLISVRYHSLKAGHYGQSVREARNAGQGARSPSSSSRSGRRTLIAQRAATSPCAIGRER